MAASIDDEGGREMGQWSSRKKLISNCVPEVQGG